VVLCRSRRSYDLYPKNERSRRHDSRSIYFGQSRDSVQAKVVNCRQGGKLPIKRISQVAIRQQIANSGESFLRHVIAALNTRGKRTEPAQGCPDPSSTRRGTKGRHSHGANRLGRGRRGHRRRHCPPRWSRGKGAS
jgi:hypothetical protein